MDATTAIFRIGINETNKIDRSRFVNFANCSFLMLRLRCAPFPKIVVVTSKLIDMFSRAEAYLRAAVVPSYLFFFENFFIATKFMKSETNSK